MDPTVCKVPKTQAFPGAGDPLRLARARRCRSASDLDFLVAEPSVDDAAEESVRLRRTLRGLGLFAEVLVASEREAEDWREVHGSLIHSALSEGRPMAV
jgi:hypothetical protein